MARFRVLHGTSKDAAASIQREGFRLSWTGFFGPAVYFFEDDVEGEDLTRRWLDKKIYHHHIKDKAHCTMLACSASCSDANYMDGTLAEIAEEVDKAVAGALPTAWKQVNKLHPSLSRKDKVLRVHTYVNSARNDVLRRHERLRGVPILFFKGFLSKGEPCFAVRDIGCLSARPYKERDYNGRPI